MRKNYVCHVCGENMDPIIETCDFKIQDAVVSIHDVHLFRCANCSERILESDEVKRIEEIVLSRI